MGFALELVRQRLEAFLDTRVGERLFQQPVRKPRIARQERAVEIRAVRALVAAALEAGRAVGAARRFEPSKSTTNSAAAWEA